MLANCSMPGVDFAFPDVCLTPVPPSPAPIPIPYPNLTVRAMALPPTASMKHLIMFMPSHHMGTTVPLSMGDNTGVLGGVASAMMMGPARNLRCSVKVITGGMPATRWLDNTLQNNTNAPGLTLVPGQFKVLYLT
jgi:Toxin PAAR-like domain